MDVGRAAQNEQHDKGTHIHILGKSEFYLQGDPTRQLSTALRPTGAPMRYTESSECVVRRRRRPEGKKEPKKQKWKR